MCDAGDKLMLPVDHVVASEFKAGAENEVVDRVPDGKMGLDIGPRTVDAFSKVIAGAKTIIWNGPMGVFEMPPFDTGTVAIAKAVANSG
jgi:phosphoglycerate kinase